MAISGDLELRQTLDVGGHTLAFGRSQWRVGLTDKLKAGCVETDGDFRVSAAAEIVKSGGDIVKIGRLRRRGSNRQREGDSYPVVSHLMSPFWPTYILLRAAKPRAEERPPVQARLALRRFRPPRLARVDIASGKPGFVAAEGIRGTVLDLAGPWRTSGDWWTADPWSRDEWDIALSDGALYRIYCEPKGWFVEGNYD